MATIKTLKKSASMSSQLGRNQFEKKAEERELEVLYNIQKKEKELSETALLAESVIAELNVAAVEDAVLNIQEKPAITKLRNLSLLTDIIPRKHLQGDLLRHGVLSALRQWLQPVPDGSVPNINVRAAVFKCLNDLTIDLEQIRIREIFKKSRIGKAVMFYCMYEEETHANRKLAKQLVDKWSQVILGISMTFEDEENFKDKKTYQAPPVGRAMSKAAARTSWINHLPELPKRRKHGLSSLRQQASRPEAMSMDFVVAPKSKVDPEAVRARAKRVAQEQPRAKLMKKLRRLAGPKRKQLLRL